MFRQRQQLKYHQIHWSNQKVKKFEQKQRSRMYEAASLIASVGSMIFVSVLLVQLLLLSAAATQADASPSLEAISTTDLHRPNHHHHHHHNQHEQLPKSKHQSSSSVYDEEINFEPLYDYDKTSAVSAAASSQIDPSSLAYSDDASSLALVDSGASRSSGSASQDDGGYSGDPFAATFEEYLKEAGSQSSAANHMGDDLVSADDQSRSSLAVAAAIKQQSSSFGEGDSSRAGSSSSRAESSGSTNSTNMKPAPRETPIIDYIFPPPPSSSSGQNNNMRQNDNNSNSNSNADADDSRLATGSNKLSASSSSSSSQSKDSQLLNEIKLLFAWKQLPTSKCSKPCGKGHQLNHVSCVDMKYEVRVEDELCLKSSLTKPSEFSDEPCNEFDCPPQWVSVIEACAGGSANHSSGTPPGGARDCRQTGGGESVYKRAQCAMVDRTGATIYLDEQKCAENNQIHHHHRHSPNHHDQPEAHVASQTSKQFDDESVELANLTEDEANYNKILAAADESSESPQSSGQSETGADLAAAAADPPEEAQSSPPVHNEPFFEASPWSGCFGDKCGQLGKRYRKLTCRIYLSRSARYADLPESSCQGAPQPDTQEPCFIDCFSFNDSHREHQYDEHQQQQQQQESSDAAADMISVVNGVHIEQRANHVLVLDTQSGRKELISNEQLVGMPLKVLGKTMLGFPKEVASRVKQLRRTMRLLSQRSSAPGICRPTTSSSLTTARHERRSKLERRNAELLEELRHKERLIAELKKRIHSCEFDNSIQAA